MSTENTETELEAAFQGGFDDGQPASQPAAEPSAPSPEAVEPPESAATDEVDELAGLPPKVRDMLTQLESLKQAASLVPTLEHRLRSAEGRVAALQKQVPAPTPPAPPRLEAVERVRAELPEVVEAMEEFFQSRQPPNQEQPAEPEPEVPSILAQEVPDWEQKVISTEFQQWIKAQEPAYRAKVESTTSEAVMLAAITKFDAHRQITAERQAAAQKAAQTRQARVAAAVVPNGAGRRAPSEPDLEALFAQGFTSSR